MAAVAIAVGGGIDLNREIVPGPDRQRSPAGPSMRASWTCRSCS
ncbi:hypothetical protein SAMN04489729_6926 [Amycolatopsis lurida]|nr:hypothetical protein SAMN04489729_6926 [Amycolatopsis lurida]